MGQNQKSSPPQKPAQKGIEAVARSSVPSYQTTSRRTGGARPRYPVLRSTFIAVLFREPMSQLKEQQKTGVRFPPTGVISKFLCHPRPLWS